MNVFEKWKKLEQEQKEEPKRCKCHDEPMFWVKDKRSKHINGGYWRCSIKNKKTERKVNNSIKGYLRKRKWELEKMRTNCENQLLQLLEEEDSAKRSIARDS